MLPIGVAEAGLEPIRRFFAQIHMFLKRHLRAVGNGAFNDSGLPAALPGMVGDHADFSGLQSEEHAGRIVGDIGERSAARMIGPHGDDITPCLEVCGHIELIEGPVGLKASRRATAHEGAVDEQPIRLVGGDGETRRFWNRRQREGFAKYRVAVVQVVVLQPRPNPAGETESFGDRGQFSGAGSQRGGSG